MVFGYTTSSPTSVMSVGSMFGDTPSYVLEFEDTDCSITPLDKSFNSGYIIPIHLISGFTSNLTPFRR
jgi:hypothetical protein